MLSPFFGQLRGFQADAMRNHNLQGSRILERASLPLITALAIFLRVQHLTYHMNFDEIAAVTSSIRSSLSSIIHSAWYPVSHKLFDILAHMAIKVFGDSDIAVRLPSVVFGVTAVPLIYWLAKKTFGSWFYGAGAAFVMAVSPMSIEWSQRARGYSLAIFLVTAAFGCLYAGFHTKRPIYWAMCSIFLALSLYTHVFSLLAIAAAGILASVAGVYRLHQSSGTKQRPIWPIIAPVIAILVGLALGLLLLYKDIPAIYESLKVQGAIWHNEMPFGPRTLLNLAGITGMGRSTPIGLIISLILVGLGILASAQRNLKVLIFLLGWLLLPITMLFFGYLLGASFSMPRYVAFLVFPAFVLLEGSGICGLSGLAALCLAKSQLSFGTRRAIQTVGITLLAAFLLWINWRSYAGMYPPYIYDFKNMAAFLKKEAKPGDLVIYEIFSRDLKYYLSAESTGVQFISLNDWVNQTRQLTRKRYRAWWIPWITINHWPLEGWAIEKFNAAKLMHLSPPREESITELSRTAMLILSEEVRQNTASFQINIQIDQKIAEGEIALSLDETERASRAFDEVLNNPYTKNSYNVECKVLHAVAAAYQDHNLLELADKYWEQAARVCEPIDHNSSNILSVNWPDAMPYFMLGKIAEKNGILGQALKQYQRAVQLRPDYSEAQASLAALLTLLSPGEEPTLLVKPQDARTNIALAKMFLEKRRLNEAKDYFKEAIQLDPNSYEARELLAETYRQAEQYDLGIAELKKVLKIRAEYAGPYYGLGQIYLDQKRFSDSIEAYYDGLKISPKALNLWVGLGNTYRASQDPGLAEKAYQTAIEFHPMEVWPKQMLAILSREQGKTEEAIDLFKQTLAIEPDRAEFHRELARLYDQIGIMDKALEEYEQAAKLQPNKPSTNIELGQFYMRTKMWMKAVDALQKAAAVDPKSAQSHAFLGQALQEAGLLEKAITEFQQAVQLAPGQQEYEKLLASTLEKR